MNFIGFIKSKSIWIICFLSFLAAFTYNEINLKHLPAERIRDTQTVVTNDDYSYLYPPQYYIEHGVWSQGSEREQAHYFRPPGYGIIYFVLLKTVGSKSSLFFLKLLQLFLFSCSVYWFYSILLSLIKNKKIALAGAAVYGISPFAIGFLYFTLTEGVTPSLLLLYLFLLFKAYGSELQKPKNIFYLSASLVFSFLFITRPVLGVFSLLIPLFLIKDYWKISIKHTLVKLVIFGGIAFSLMAIWQIRNYKISDHYVGINPIYDTEQVSMYRPPFKAYWEFSGGLGKKGHITLSVMDPFWIAAINRDTSQTYINNIIKSYPDHVVTFFGKERLVNTFKKYQTVIINQSSAFENHTILPKEMPQLEQELTQEIEQLTNEYKSGFWLKYYITSPLKVFKTMAFHSNLSLYMFQQTYRGNILMEITRVVFFGLHSLCFIGLLLSLFFFRNNDWRILGITLPLLIYIFFLAYFQRGLEERYTLPILPLLLIGLVTLLNQLKSLLRR
jgi:hypothetical protein